MMCAITTGPIPEELSNLEELEQLSLADNNLEGVPTTHYTDCVAWFMPYLKGFVHVSWATSDPLTTLGPL